MNFCNNFEGTTEGTLNHGYWRRGGGKERETWRKRESPRALRGRSEKCRQMLEDVPEVFSLLQCVILSHQADREREHNNNRRRQEILTWRQSSAINEAHAFMFIWLADVNAFAHVYIWVQTWVTHTNTDTKGSLICITLSSCHCSTCCIPGPVKELREDCIKTFVAVSFHSAAYNTERVSHCLQTATATYPHTHTPAKAMSVHPRTLSMSVLIKPALSL